MSAEKYPHVFSPIRIGPIEIKNRFYNSPHGNPYNVAGGPSDAFARYYGARAEGGCGLLFHTVAVMPRRGGLGITPYLEETIPAFRAVADHVHERGAKLFGQIHYSRVQNGWRFEPGSSVAPLLAPSSVQISDGFHSTSEMSVDLIRKVIEAHRISSANLARAGYDGIEIHCAHAMLCEAFLSPYMNRRTDEWGGPLENRMRFLVECLKAAREGAGPELAIGMRYNADELVHAEGGLTQAETKEVLRRLIERRLLNFVDIDIALEPDQIYFGMPPYLMPKQMYRPYVESLREVTGTLPVLSVLGRIHTVAEAEEAIAAGVVDLVGSARQLIAEPDLVRQAHEGHEEDSRTCLHCNICLDHTDMFGCAINPETGRERMWREYHAAASSQRVVVVGGGPAGIEAARVAAKRGHEVVLFERGDALGGQMRLWAALPGCEIFATTPAWYERQLHKLDVEVRLGVHATPQLVLAERPGAVVIATGSRYLRNGESGYRKAPIEGWEGELVLTPEDVLEGSALPRGKVLVLDEEGITTGCGIAELLAATGAQVTLLSSWLTMLAHLPEHVVHSELARLKSAGVALMPRTYIRRIGPDSVTIYDVDTDVETLLDGVEAVVFATSRRQSTELARSLDGKVDQLLEAGDALAPRGLAEAIHEGHRFARLIGEPDAPRNFAEAYFAPIDYAWFQRPATELEPAAAVG